MLEVLAGHFHKYSISHPEPISSLNLEIFAGLGIHKHSPDDFALRVP
jgi:hypothetical protein